MSTSASRFTKLDVKQSYGEIPESRAPTPAKTLNPVFDLNGMPHVMVTQFLAAVPESLLKTCLSSQDHHRDEITAALDLLFQGF